MKPLVEGLVIKNAAGFYLVLKDMDTGKFRLVNLYTGVIYVYDENFIKEYRESTEDTSVEFYIKDALANVKI